MPRFYFNLHECGVVVADEDGLELPNLEAATAAAVENARDVMAGEVKAGRLCLGCAIAIEDEQHRQVGWLPFSEAVRVSGLERAS